MIDESKEREARGKRRERVLRVHVVWVCLVILCGMPLSPRLWLAALLLLQASKSASLPTALIRGSLPGAGDELAESVRKCTHHASLAASRHGPRTKGGVATSSNPSHDSSAFLSYPSHPQTHFSHFLFYSRILSFLSHFLHFLCKHRSGKRKRQRGTSV